MTSAEPAIAAPSRLLAAWQNMQTDGMGSTYYFYPDGLLVMQNPRRREFVVLARWRMQTRDVVVISDEQPLNTTLSRAELAKWRKGSYPWRIVSLTRRELHWVFLNDPKTSDVFRYRGPLPDRTENVYWGLGTDESYARGIRKEIGGR
ncbi:MAG: hypothetical protein ACJ8LL_02610 [Candidatus Udaeobacter sp.]